MQPPVGAVPAAVAVLEPADRITPAAATGIPGEDGVHFAVAESDEDLVERMLALLAREPAAQALGRAARRLVVERMSWPAMLAPLARILGKDPDARDAA